MKTWEMLKELTENPSNGKIFEATNKLGNTYQILKGALGYFELTVFDKNGKRFEFDVPAGGFNGNIHGDYDWEEVPQEVTWQEAIEAWANGKTVKCAARGYDSIYQKYDVVNDCDDSFLVDEQANPMDAYEILEGKWYILEGTK